MTGKSAEKAWDPSTTGRSGRPPGTHAAPARRRRPAPASPPPALAPGAWPRPRRNPCSAPGRHRATRQTRPRARRPQRSAVPGTPGLARLLGSRHPQPPDALPPLDQGLGSGLLVPGLPVGCT